MTKKMDKIGVAEIKNQQLLDNSSDFNNFENLSYFISEYKKAKEIISQCQSFYYNFLRTKLYSIDKLKNIPNINFVDLHLCLRCYCENVDKLTKYILFNIAQKELRKISDNYDLKFFDLLKGTSGKCYDDCENTWSIYAKNDSLFYDTRLFNFLTSCLFNNLHIYSSYPTTDINSWIYDNYIRESCVNKKYIETNKLKAIQIQKEKRIYNSKTELYSIKKETYENGKPVMLTFYELGKEEKNLIEFIEKFRKTHSYKELYNKIFSDPEKYYDKWLDYVEFEKSNVKITNFDILYVSDDKLRKIKEHEKIKGIFCPAVFLKYNKYINKNDFQGEYKKIVTSENCYIEAYNFLNKKIINLYQDWEEDKKHEYDKGYVFKTWKLDDHHRKIYINNYIGLFESDLSPYLLLDIPRLLDIVKQSSDYTDIDFREYHNEIFPYENYFTIINCTPFKFADSLRNVNIEYNENTNILKCSYSKEKKYKKYRFPSNSPWTVITFNYSLDFDCSNNEPIGYRYVKNTREESIRNIY